MLEIFLDENVTVVDRKLLRVTVGVVEMDDSNVNVSVNEVLQILDDPIRFPARKKFHTSSMNEVEATSVIEIVSKLQLKARMYTYYFISKDEMTAKLNAMIRTVEHVNRLHIKHKISIQIEYASEYTKSSLNKYLVRDNRLFIIVDSVLSAYTHYLDNLDNRSTSISLRNYTLLKNKVRLQSFFSEVHAEYNIGNKRL